MDDSIIGWRWKDKVPSVERLIEKMNPVIRSALRDAWNGRGPGFPVLLAGGAGTGKTRAALVMGDFSGGCCYTTLEDLCTTLIDAQQGRLQARGEHGEVSVTTSMVWAEWRNCHVAFLDEIGARDRVSDHHYSTMKQALDERLNYDKPLVCITNLSPTDLVRIYDDRVVSRLCSGTVVFCGVEDRRVQS